MESRTPPRPPHISLPITFSSLNIVALLPGNGCRANLSSLIAAFIQNIVVSQVIQPFPYWQHVGAGFPFSPYLTHCYFLSLGHILKLVMLKVYVYFHCHRYWDTIFPKGSSDSVSCFEPLQFLGLTNQPWVFPSHFSSEPSSLLF